MKFLLAYLCTVMFVISPGLLLSADGVGLAMIEAIHFMGERDGGEVIHFKLNRDLNPKVLELHGENPRVVFDFIETGYSAEEERVINVGARFVKRIRVGMHQQPVAKTRVVIDLTGDKEFDIENEFILAEKVLEVRVFLKTTDGEGKESKSAVAERKSEKEEQLQAQPVGNDPTQGNMSPASAQVVNNIKLHKSETAAQRGQVETTITNKDTIMASQLPEMSGEVAVKNQIADSEDTDIAITKEAPVLISVSYENTTNNKEMVLFKLNGFHPPVLFAIEEEEPRIVCDFLDVQLGAATQQVLNSKGEYIRRVRVAKHSNPDKVRVVLDLVANKDYDLKQVFFKEDNLFVVIISTL